MDHTAHRLTPWRCDAASLKTLAAHITASLITPLAAILSLAAPVTADVLVVDDVGPFSGDGGELVSILFSPDVAGLTVQGLGGALLPGTPLLTLDVVLPLSGELSLTTPVPAGIQSGADGAELHLQVLGADPRGGGLLGSGSTLTILSASF